MNYSLGVTSLGDLVTLSRLREQRTSYIGVSAQILQTVS